MKFALTVPYSLEETAARLREMTLPRGIELAGGGRLKGRLYDYGDTYFYEVTLERNQQVILVGEGRIFALNARQTTINGVYNPHLARLVWGSMWLLGLVLLLTCLILFLPLASPLIGLGVLGSLGLLSWWLWRSAVPRLDECLARIIVRPRKRRSSE
jgi:hypothetical protein